MKSINDQILFVDTVLLPFFGIKSIVDYDSTFEITSEINLKEFNLIIPDFRIIFPAKEFSLHKTQYKIETSNQALCLLKKSMELIQLPYTIDTITQNKISFKQVRLIRTNLNLYNYIERKMSEIRSLEICKPNLIPVDSISSSKSHKSYDIAGRPPNPKTIVSPWNNSSYEPDVVHDLKPIKNPEISLQYDDLEKAIESTSTAMLNFVTHRIVNKGICKIPLKHHTIIDQYVNSIKCCFKSQKINNENIISDYYIDYVIQGATYQILIGGNELVTGTFYNNKELLPEIGDTGKIMFLCNKILTAHNAVLEIKFDSHQMIGLKFIDVSLTVGYAQLNENINESLIETTFLNFSANYFIKKTKKHNVCGVEQLIKNEKQLYNKARCMGGMHGNAYCEYQTLEYITQPRISGSTYTAKFEILPKNVTKHKIPNCNMLGHLTLSMENPEAGYHFCCTQIAKTYSSMDPSITYDYSQNETTTLHRYEMSHKINSYDISLLDTKYKRNVNGIYGIGEICVFPQNVKNEHNIEIDKFKNVRLYAMVLNYVDNDIKLEKIELKIKFNLCNDSTCLILSCTKIFYGFVLEIISDNNTDQCTDIHITFNKIIFNDEINAQLATHPHASIEFNEINI